MLNGMGLHSGVDMGKLVSAGAFICNALGIQTRSRAARALIAANGDLTSEPCAAPHPAG